MNAALLTSVAILLALTTSHAASRFEEFTKKFEHSKDRAEIVTSTLLGGNGTEWLAAGGFQPDGTIVVAGTALGPTFDLGMQAVVLGNDAPIGQPTRRPLLRGGRPQRDKTGNQIMEPLAWSHPNATAFVVRLSPDAKKVISLTRFGWKAGGLTDALVDDSGFIYLCGPAGPGSSSVAGNSEAITGSTNSGIRDGCAAIFLAKLLPDASSAVWMRTITGSSPAPTLKLNSNGHVQLLGADLRVFDSAGSQIRISEIPGGAEGHVAVNPKDGAFARGGEHHWPTGREPYRDPILNIYRPEGSLLYELYNWDGPFVGLNELRLVSDSAIRGVTYDRDGTLILHAWSDGGNSVMYREPHDIFTASKNMHGLGMSIWGAGVLSCAYVIKLDPATYNVAAGTLWVGYLHDRNKPNSVTINALDVAADGSVCVAGSSAYGLIRTGNAFKDEPTGNYVAVMSKNLESLRFCSTVSYAGETEIGRADKQWGIASGMVNGKPRVMFLSGAVQSDASSNVPTLNAMQEKYGGGMADGHLLLLDLSTSAANIK